MASAPGTGTNTGTKKNKSKVTTSGRVGNAKSAPVKTGNSSSTKTAGRGVATRAGTSVTTNPRAKTAGTRGAFKKVAPKVKGVSVNKGRAG